MSRRAQTTTPNFPITARGERQPELEVTTRNVHKTIQYSPAPSITHLPDTHQILVVILYRLSQVIPRDLTFQPQPK